MNIYEILYLNKEVLNKCNTASKFKNNADLIVQQWI